MSILDSDHQLRSTRAAIIRRVGEPLTEFTRGENVTRHHLQFTKGRVILERRDGQQGWSVVEDTTPSAAQAPELPSGPSSGATSPPGRSLAEALEAVNGSTAEETLRRRVASLARHRGGVLHTIQRFTFGNGTVVSFLRNQGQAGWMQVEA